MRPVSVEFLRTLRGSHQMVAEARIVAPGLTGVNPAGTEIPILSGDVHIDGTANIGSTLDLTTDGQGMWPTAASDLLAPYGNELFVRRGIAFGNGTTEWVSLGYFRIQAPEQADAPNGPIRISAQDRMAGIVEARLIAPIQYQPGTTLGTIFTALVGEVYPWATIEWDDATDASTLGRALTAEEDRYKFLNDLVTAAGKVWYWNHRGVLRIETPPAPVDPVWDVNAGGDGVLVNVSRQLSREGVYNAVVATGEAADTEAPARAVAVDDNPESPTYWSGSFGKVPRFYSSPFLTTDAQAASAAEAMLTRSLGLPYSVDFTAVPNPALEPYDPVRVTYLDGRRETHLIERLTVPLAAEGALTASTREQTLIVIGVS
jgi:hypothetical protein